MERNPTLVIQEAYGELSRAFKKLKKLEADPVRKAAYGDLAKAYRKLKARAVAEERPPPSQFKMKWDTAEQYMGSGRVLWGCNFHFRFMDEVVRDQVRADRFKNRWLVDCNRKKGWRSLGEDEFRSIFQQVKDFREGIFELFETYPTREEWLDKVGFVTERQWERRRLVNSSIKLNYKMFVAHCIKEHKRQRPLRG